MEISGYLQKMKNIQENLIRFLDDQKNVEYELADFKKFLDDQSLKQSTYVMKEFLYLICTISNNHHRTFSFITKIEQILIYLKDTIAHDFSNTTIFNIFRNNKRILLFLFEENILHIDRNIISTMRKLDNNRLNYYEYFLPEILAFYQNKEHAENIPDSFQQMRKLGENENKLCQMIRNDSINDFIKFANQANLSLSSQIDSSRFETNPLLLSKQPSLIEYAAFFGSIQIIKYLFLNKVNFTASIWIYAVHSNNPELIHFLEENNAKPNKIKEILLESIGCHHNEIANYIIENYFDGNLPYALSEILKYYNYAYYSNNDLQNDTFFVLCKYDYLSLVNFLLKDQDVNSFYIQNFHILIQFVFTYLYEI